MSFTGIGDGTKDVHYQEYRHRKISDLMRAAAEGDTFVLDLGIMGSNLKTPPLNLNRADMDRVLDLFETLNGERKPS